MYTGNLYADLANIIVENANLNLENTGDASDNYERGKKLTEWWNKKAEPIPYTISTGPYRDANGFLQGEKYNYSGDYAENMKQLAISLGLVNANATTEEINIAIGKARDEHNSKAAANNNSKYYDNALDYLIARALEENKLSSEQ
jgi:hypothetical protein